MRSWFSRPRQLAPVLATALALLCAVIGAWLLRTPSAPGAALRRASYDSYFDTLGLSDGPPADSPVVIAYLDLESHLREGRDPAQPWPRERYAALVNRLTAAGARAVVFDVVFDSPGANDAANSALRDAIAKHGRVVLAGELSASSSDPGEGSSGRLTSVAKPIEPLRRASADWGLGELATDEDFVVRRFFAGNFVGAEPAPSLVTATVRLLARDAATTVPSPAPPRWLYYYGPPFALPHRGFSQTLDGDAVPNDFFRDKVVFIGARPIAGLFQARRDEFRSPFRAWREPDRFMPGVEVHATQMLNALRGDWRTRLTPEAEICLVVLVGVLLGVGLFWLRPVPATFTAVASGAMVLAVAAVAFRQAQVWFPWLIVAAVQLPVALTGSVLFHSLDWILTRRRLEAAKRTADARIREQAALLEKAHDAILVRRLDGRFTYVNPSAERLFGWPAAELLNGAAPALLADGDARAAQRAAQLHGEWHGELHQTTRTGKSLTLESRWTLLRDDSGSPQGWLIMSFDVTDKKQLEAETLRLQRTEAIGALAGGMAHDLNNSLAPILMGTQLLRRDARDENSRRILSLMESSTRRGADMVRQVLLFARGRQGDSEPLDPRRLVRETEQLARDTFPRNITVSAQIADDVWPVRGNATQLHQVLLNLCVNARDAMPNGGALSLVADNVELGENEEGRMKNEEDPSAFCLLPSAFPPGGAFVVLMVSDTGTGIAPENLPKIFDAFFTTKPEGQGTGLGLSTTARIVKAHEGFVAVQSQPGQGTTFEVYLPRFVPTSAEPSRMEETPAPHGHGQSVLVAEDDEAVRELLRRGLEDHGYRVVVAANGAEAVTQFKQHSAHIAVLITDVSMPVMDGPQAAEKIRTVAPALPVLFLSSDAGSAEANAASPSTNTRRLAKPFQWNALLHILAELVTVTR